MDQNLHAISPVSIDNCKLGKNYPLRQFLPTFIFEPKDLVPFELAWDWQKEQQKSLLENSSSSQAVWLLQHSTCFTLGRGASEKNLLFQVKKPPLPLYRIDRGGEVTLHTPGQLVAYLVLDLHRYKTDLNWYLRQLEEVLIELISVLGLKGERMPGLTGIWIKGYKVASIGIGCRRWITQHGLALNVDCDLREFGQIVPCGLKGKSVGKLDQWLPGITISDVQPLMRECLINHFDLL